MITKTTTYLLTYLLTPCSTVPLEKLTGSQPVKKFPAFYGTRMFITAFTNAHNLSLTLARSSPYPRVSLPEDQISCPSFVASVVLKYQSGSEALSVSIS